MVYVVEHFSDRGQPVLQRSRRQRRRRLLEMSSKQHDAGQSRHHQQPDIYGRRQVAVAWARQE